MKVAKADEPSPRMDHHVATAPAELSPVGLMKTDNKDKTQAKKSGNPSMSKPGTPQRDSLSEEDHGQPPEGRKKLMKTAKPEAMDHSKTTRLLHEGDLLMGRFSMGSMLAGGGFGQVYLGTDILTGQRYAVKAQGGKEHERRVKLEMMLYAELRGRKHIPLLVAACPLPHQCGIALVMQLCGRSLADVRRQMPGKRLSQPTLFVAMRQVLTAISFIHEVGFLHRDVKPPNCCLGAVDVGRVYLLDFGLCRHYVDSAGMTRRVRKEAPFRGTVRYASLAVHAKQEFGPCNDLVAFLYSTVELGNGGLPWSHITSKEKIEAMKRDIGCEKLCYSFPELLDFTEKVMSMRQETLPDYAQLMALFDRLQPAGLKYDQQPLDWEVNSCDLELKALADEGTTTAPEKN